MQHETIQQVVEELETTLLEHFVGRVFQLTPDSLAIDFGVRSSGYLFVSAAPAQPRNASGPLARSRLLKC